eukprot:scaffold27229_cov146-Isochrysis_galbana.AAC.3
MDRHHNGLVRRGRLWILPAVIGAIQRSDRTLTLHRRVAHAHMELCRSRNCADASAIERAGKIFGLGS